MIKIVKEHIGIHYLPKKNPQLYTLIHLEFRIENIPQEVLNKIKDRSITHNIFRIQDNEFIMCWFHCITFIEYMFAGKTLLVYTNLFSPIDSKENDRIIYKYFKNKYDRRRTSQF